LAYRLVETGDLGGMTAEAQSIAVPVNLATPVDVDRVCRSVKVGRVDVIGEMLNRLEARTRQE
jgi:hypothetical protein